MPRAKKTRPTAQKNSKRSSSPVTRSASRARQQSNSETSTTAGATAASEHSIHQQPIHQQLDHQQLHHQQLIHQQGNQNLQQPAILANVLTKLNELFDSVMTDIPPSTYLLAGIIATAIFVFSGLLMGQLELVGKVTTAEFSIRGAQRNFWALFDESDHVTPTSTAVHAEHDCGTTVYTGVCSDRWHQAGMSCAHTLTCREWTAASNGALTSAWKKMKAADAMPTTTEVERRHGRSQEVEV